MKNKILNNVLNNFKNIYFIGIGGSGMIGLVQILKQLNLNISGSDINESDPLNLAKSLGVDITLNQTSQNIQNKNPDLIIYTSAILENNAELIQAKQSQKPIMERSELLGKITKCFSNCICVSGTHGKTTTTAMITEILNRCHLNPSAIIGGNLKSINGYGKIGNKNILICEACEFNNHFLKLSPTHCVILNIDRDHMEFFKTVKNLKNSFKQFCNNTKNCIVYYGDDENTTSVIKAANNFNKTCISFGFGENNTFKAENLIKLKPTQTQFNVRFQGHKLNQIFELNIPGKHNIINALAAISMCHNLGINFNQIADGLKYFKGVKRRFEIVGQVNGITVVDDYAHHPKEIMATLKTAKNFGFNKIWAIHQPFTYSRTHMLLNAFAEALKIADEVILTEILGSREENITGIKSKHLADKIAGSKVFQTQKEAADYVLQHAKPGDLVITMGCGDIYKCARIIVFGKY